MRLRLKAQEKDMEDNFSILDREPAFPRDKTRPAFYRDLNLDQIIQAVTLGWNAQVKKFYLYFPKNEACEAYRRAVFRDIKKKACYEALTRFLETAKEMQRYEKREEEAESDLQKTVWHLWAVRRYCEAFEGLLEKLQGADLSSEGLKTFRSSLETHLSSEEYRKMAKEASSLLDRLMSLRFVITYDRDRILISEGKTDGAYESLIEKNGDRDRVPLKSPFFANPNLSVLEYECLKVLSGKEPQLFSSLKATAEKYQAFGEEFCFRFIQEIPFYLSYRAFQLEMEQKGFLFCTPSADPGKEMEADGLYDLALALASVRDGRKVVSNQVRYHEGERFFVLTGPNQGGKTTFARSLGQLVFFTKMGLDVPAESANVHPFRNILTHFSVEESVETGRGKLKEELERLAPMMEAHEANAFVVINELFTTASTNDAEIMGKKVLSHFIGQNCRGIYVTHIRELAQSQPGVVSLRAMLNAEKLQTFRIERSEAEDWACAANQVNKYRLTYEQLKERL